MASNTQEYMQINSRINKKLYGRIQKYLASNNILLVDFMTVSFEEKLSRSIKDDETLSTMVDQIKKMDPLALHGSLSDLVYTAQVIFKEVKKQNELLKLMHESVSLAGTFTYEMWKEEQTEEDASEWFNAIIKDAQNEIKQIDL